MSEKYIDENKLNNVSGGVDEVTFTCKNPSHLNHNICCNCGWIATKEMERTYCRKYRTENGGDGKYHYFCKECINKLALN